RRFVAMAAGDAAGLGMPVLPNGDRGVPELPHVVLADPALSRGTDRRLHVSRAIVRHPRRLGAAGRARLDRIAARAGGDRDRAAVAERARTAQAHVAWMEHVRNPGYGHAVTIGKIRMRIILAPT